MLDFFQKKMLGGGVVLLGLSGKSHKHTAVPVTLGAWQATVSAMRLFTRTFCRSHFE